MPRESAIRGLPGLLSCSVNIGRQAHVLLIIPCHNFSSPTLKARQSLLLASSHRF